MANLRKNTKNNAFEIPLLNDGMWWRSLNKNHVGSHYCGNVLVWSIFKIIWCMSKQKFASVKTWQNLLFVSHPIDAGTPLKSETVLNCSKKVLVNGVKRLAWVGDSIVLWRGIGKKVDVAWTVPITDIPFAQNVFLLGCVRVIYKTKKQSTALPWLQNWLFQTERFSYHKNYTDINMHSPFTTRNSTNKLLNERFVTRVRSSTQWTKAKVQYRASSFQVQRLMQFANAADAF